MILYDLILPMDFNIDTATTDDLPEILELNEAALPAVSSVNLVDMEHFLSIAEYFRILKIKDQILGFLIALTPGKNYQSLDRIVIAPAFHGNGFGRAFYDNLSDFSSEQAPRITCEVNIRPMNEGSILFHEKYGFDQVGTQETEGRTKEVSLMAIDLPNY